MSHVVSLPEVGRRLKEAAQEAGLTLRELGERMGVSRPTIYAYASGALRMSEARLEQAAEILGKPVSFFEPRGVEDLDPRSSTVSSLRLVDALMAPASPRKASEAAMEALEAGVEGDAPAIRAELLRRSGNALALSGDYVTAVRHLEAASALFEEQGANEKVAACAQTLGVCYINLGQVDRALTHFEAARSLLPEDQQWKAEVALAALAERIGRFAEAESQLSAILDKAKLCDQAMAYVRANYASILCVQGQWKSGLAQSETALQAAFESGLTDQVAEMLIQCCSGLTHVGRLQEATLMALRAKDVCFALRDDARSTLADISVARLVGAFGDHDSSRVMAAEAYSKALQGQYRRSESHALLLQSELALRRGDWQVAHEYALQAKSHSIAYKYVVAHATSAGLEALALAALGEPKRAAAALAEGQEAAKAFGEGRPHVLLLEAQGAMDVAEDSGLKALREAERLAERLGLLPDANRLGQEVAAWESGALERNLTQWIDKGPQGPIMEGEVWTRALKGLPLTEDR